MTRKSLLIVFAMVAVFMAGLPIAGSAGAVARPAPTVYIDNYCETVWGSVDGGDLTDWFLEVKTSEYTNRTPLAYLPSAVYWHGETVDGVIDFALFDGDIMVDALTHLDGTYVEPAGCGGEDPEWDVKLTSKCDEVILSYELRQPFPPEYVSYQPGYPDDPSNLGEIPFPSWPSGEFVFDDDGRYRDYSISLLWSNEGEPYIVDGSERKLTATKPSEAECNPPPTDPFNDDDDSVFEADIEWMAAKGITKGCNPPVNDKFCPDGVVTRGQMAAFLTRALGLTERLDDPFTDDDESVFEADIEKLAAAGITKGCNPPTNDRFCPDGKVTREVMAAFLVRALDYTDDGGGDLFADDDDSIFEGDIDRLGTAGVTRGCNPPANTRFCPKGNVTRGQMAAFLHRALG